MGYSLVDPLCTNMFQGRNGQVRMMTPFLEPSGAYTSSAVLTMRVQEQHRPMMRLTCRAKVISIHIEDSLNLRVEEAPHMLANWFGSGEQIFSRTVFPFKNE